MSAFLRRLTWWRRRRVTEEELREELGFHLAEEAAERHDDGLSPEESRRRAHIDLGNALVIREDVRTLWTWTMLEQFAQDVRYALRTMMRYRLVVGLAIASLALGIGANTAIYSFMDALLFRSGLPSAVRGVAADISTRPSALRGAPALGYRIHRAARGLDASAQASTRPTVTRRVEPLRRNKHAPL